MFERRQFLCTGLIAGAAAGLPAVPSFAASGMATRRFIVTTTVDLPASDETVQLWLPVFQSDPAYQKRLGVHFEGDGQPRLYRDAKSGAELVQASFAAGTTARKLTLTQDIATWERAALPATRLSAAERARWLAPAPGVQTDGLVRETALKIVGDTTEPRARVRKLYDWMVVNTFRDAATLGCGAGDAQALLVSGRLGGKCVDLSGLMVAFSRSLGIPAREVYGIRLAPSALAKSLGRGPDVTGAQHCRAEVWLDGADHNGADHKGTWFAIDPADVRKSVLEDKVPVDSPVIQALAERLFGAWENNWAGYNRATGLVLPDAPREAMYHFLMYPAAMSASKVANCVDAKTFQYKITSIEVTA
jgi:transglutaminase-like putative cysteine protease